MAKASSPATSSSHRNASLKRRSRAHRGQSQASRYVGAVKPRKASQISLDRQLEIPLGFLAAVLVCHALSGTSSLSLAHLSAHLPSSIQRLLPAWARRLPDLAPFASDVPNASHDSKSMLMSSAGATWAHVVGQAGPFRSDAAGFGHPLTALHTFTRACLGLSYALPSSDPSQVSAAATTPTQPEPWVWLVGRSDTMYAKGPKDALYVLTWILIWTVLRAAFMRFLFAPLGARWVAKPRFTSPTHRLRQLKVWEKNITRFAERSWSVFFYSCYWSFGLYIAYHSDYWLDTSGFWTDHPHTQMQGIAKLYYLTQCAYWFHMLLVINVEARRKDHWQMLSHHVITICLIVGSYCTHFTRVGNAVLCLMDPSDILLDLAKCLRYMGLQTLCDVTFGFFLVTWITTRHVLFGIVIWACLSIVPKASFERVNVSRSVASTLTPAPTMTLAQWWADAEAPQLILSLLLLALQVLLLLWFAMIVRIAYRVVTGAGAADSRSDEELSDEDEQELRVVEKDDVRSAKSMSGKALCSTATHACTALSPSPSPSPSGGGATAARWDQNRCDSITSRRHKT
ncbi:unnamed protein product [Parajaminaea phylloscopi]